MLLAVQVCEMEGACKCTAVSGAKYSRCVKCRLYICALQGTFVCKDVYGAWCLVKNRGKYS